MNHSERAHSPLGPSSAHRWLKCPASVRLSAGVEEQPKSGAAEYGTQIHELAETRIRHLLLGEPQRPLGFVPDSAQREMAEAFVTFAIRQAARFAEPVVRVEEQVDYGHVVPDGWGTADLIIYDEASGTLVVADLKTGRWPVEAFNNPQLMLYGVGALRLFPDATSCELYIVQPSIEQEAQFTIHPADLRAWAYSYVMPRAQETQEPNSKAVAGDHCVFCPARAICTTRNGHLAEELDALANDFRSPDVMSYEQIARMMRLATDAAAWLKDVEDFLRAKVDELPPNLFKVQQKRATTRWREGVTPELLAERTGLPAETFTKKSLCAIGDVKRALKARGIGPEVLDELTEKKAPEGVKILLNL